MIHLYRPAPIRAQSKPLEGLFLCGVGQYFIVPDLSGLIPELPGESLINPLPGFRAGLGYEWNNLRLSLESGWTKIEGGNPLVLEAQIIPVMFNAGWDFRFFEKAGIRFGPVLGFGLTQAGAEHYQNVLAIILDDISHSQGLDLLAHAGLEASWTFLTAFSLYAEGGVSLVPETDGLIPLPEVHAGIRLRPFALHRAAAFQRKLRTEPAPPPPLETPKPTIPEPETPETAPAAETFREVYTVYFGPDSVTPFEDSLAALDLAGGLLAERQDLRVTLNGYAAPFASAAGQMAVSQQRARYCAEYFQTAWSIAPERITTQWFGADALPEGADTSHASLRAVEIIIDEQSRNMRREGE